VPVLLPGLPPLGRRPLTEARPARAGGAAVTAAAAKKAAPKDAIPQSSYDAGRVALLTIRRRQNDNIAGIAWEACHLADGIRIELCDAAAGLRRHPIIHSSA